MPLLAKHGDRYIAALQCGAGRDAYIQIEVTDQLVDEVELVQLPPCNSGRLIAVEPEKIKEAVIKAFRESSLLFGLDLNLRCIAYFPNDSRHYDLHARCTALIVEALATGKEFRELPS